MSKPMLAALVVIVLLVSAVAGQKLAPPKLEPTPSTESQKQLIKEGVSLHDKGDYNAAINRYEQVLKENPNDVLALYEMSYSYYQQKNYKKSIEVASRAAQYKSPLLDAIYVQIGSGFDELGEPQKAIEVYRSGIKLSPSSSLLQYNLGFTYYRTQQLEEAKIAVKKAAALDPNHISSQILLATIFDKGAYKVPTILAALRFLILEPGSKRSAVALQLVKKHMQAGVSPKDGNNISIFMETGQKKDEGDFESVSLFLSLMQAANYSDAKKGKSEIQLLAGNLNSLFAMFSESANKADLSKFTWKYYVPYFVELKKQGHTEAFVYYVNQQSTMAGVSEWLEHNDDKVAAFLAWSKAYRWPETAAD